MTISCPCCKAVKQVPFAYEYIKYKCEFCGGRYVLGWEQEKLPVPELISKEVTIDNQKEA